MGYGFSCINNNDIVVIDQEYSNYALHSIVTITYSMCSVGYFQNNFGSWYCTIYVPNIPGIIAFSDSTEFISCYGSLSANGTSQTIIIDYIDQNTSFNIAFYVPSNNLTSSTGYGLNVYKSNAELCFSSSLRYAKHDVTHVASTWNSLALPYSVNATGYKMFETSAFRAMGDYNFQPEGGLFYSGTAMYYGRINGNYLETWSQGTDMWSLMQNTGAMGSMMILWDDYAHFYLGVY